MKILLLSLLVAASAFAQCGSNGTLIINPLTGNWDCTGAAGAGSGTVTSIATTSPITGGTITATGTIACGTCVTSSVTQTADRILKGNGSKDTVVSGASIDSNDKGAFPGGIDLGTGSGKTGYELLTGKTSGSAGFTVADVAGTQILYMLPVGSGATNDVLADSGSATCPDMPAGAPTNCHQLIWTANGGGGGGGSVTTGTYASLPGTCTTGAVYWPTDSFYQFLCTNTDTWTPYINGKAAALPGAVSGWTAVNGAANFTATDTGGAINIQVDYNASLNWRLLTKTQPGGDYTVTAFYTTRYSIADTQLSGLYFYDGTKLMGIELLYNSGTPKFRAEKITNVNADNGTAAVTPGVNLISPGVWFQISKISGTLSFNYSLDGVVWTTLFSEAVGTFITPTKYGFGGLSYFTSGTSMNMSMQSLVVQ